MPRKLLQSFDEAYDRTIASIVAGDDGQVAILLGDDAALLLKASRAHWEDHATIEVESEFGLHDALKFGHWSVLTETPQNES